MDTTLVIKINILNSMINYYNQPLHVPTTHLPLFSFILLPWLNHKPA